MFGAKSVLQFCSNFLVIDNEFKCFVIIWLFSGIIKNAQDFLEFFGNFWEFFWTHLYFFRYFSEFFRNFLVLFKIFSELRAIFLDFFYFWRFSVIFGDFSKSFEVSLKFYLNGCLICFLKFGMDISTKKFVE